jgi:hypothetical protein
MSDSHSQGRVSAKVNHTGSGSLSGSHLLLCTFEAPLGAKKHLPLAPLVKIEQGVQAVLGLLIVENFCKHLCLLSSGDVLRPPSGQNSLAVSHLLPAGHKYVILYITLVIAILQQKISNTKYMGSVRVKM